MPPKFDRCVKRIMGQGKSKSSAYAICVAMWKRTRGTSPFKEEGKIDLTEYENVLKTTELKQLEKEMIEEEPEVFWKLQKELESVNEEETQEKKNKTLEELTGKSGRTKR